MGLREPHRRPQTAQSFASQETDHQHDNLLSFLVDDRYFKGKEPMKSKRSIKDSILHKQPTKRQIKSRRNGVGAGQMSKDPIKDQYLASTKPQSSKRLSDEERRM